MISRWWVWGLCSLVWMQGHALAQRLPVSDALTRPAVMVKDPSKVALFSVARASTQLVAVGERGVIVVSEDDGRQWRQMPSPVSVTLTAVTFADERHGVAVGHGGVVLSTNDGGQTWAVRLDGQLAAKLALASAHSPETVREAERLVADGPDKPFFGVLMWDAQRWLVAGAYGLIFETRDAGATWKSWMERVPNENFLHWYSMVRRGDTLLMAGEQGLLARSFDGGQTFESVPSPYRGSWFVGDVDRAGRWLLGGMRGNVWRSDDAGTSWTQLDTPLDSSILAMARDGGEQGAERLLLAAQAGVLLEVVNDGLKPVKTNRPATMPTALLHLPNGDLMALGVTGVTLMTPTERMAKP